MFATLVIVTGVLLVVWVCLRGGAEKGEAPEWIPRVSGALGGVCVCLVGGSIVWFVVEVIVARAVLALVVAWGLTAWIEWHLSGGLNVKRWIVISCVVAAVSVPVCISTQRMFPEAGDLLGSVLLGIVGSFTVRFMVTGGLEAREKDRAGKPD